MSSRVAAHVHLARNAGELWPAAIQPWFEHACRDSWRSRLPTVALVPSRAHGYFLRSRLLEHELSFAGIHFWTAFEIRDFLTAKFLPERTVATRENLHLLIAAAAEAQPAEPAAAAVALAPDHFLRVIDSVEAAGWDFAETGLPSLKNLAREFKRLVADAGLQTLTQADEFLLREAQKNAVVIGPLLVCGFNVAHWPLWKILRGACSAATQATICLTQSRAQLADIDAAWVGSWEEIFGAAQQTPALDAEESFAHFAEAVELGAPGNKAGVSFRVGASTLEQAQAAVVQSLAWLADDRCERLGIMFPGYGALSREVAALLETRGIPHNDVIGHLRPGVFESEAWQAWLAAQENPRIGTLVRFTRACPAAIIAPLRSDAIEGVLRNAFNDILINDLAVLAAFLDREQNSDAKKEVGRFLKSFELLPESAPLAQFNQTAASIFKKFEWQEQAAEIARQSVQLQKFAAPISRRAYLRWLSEIIDSFQRVRADNGAHPYAKVHLVSYDQAHGQRWSHLIFTSLNEAVWPARPVESGYLSEHEIDALNANIVRLNREITREGRQGQGHLTVAEGKAFCVGPSQQRWFAQRQFLDLIESVEIELCATAGLSDEKDPARRLKPGDFFNRLFFADRAAPVSDRDMDSLHELTRRWVEASRVFLPQAHDEGETAPMLRAFHARRDQTQRFGEFEFALKTTPPEPLTIPCTSWDRVISAPAAVWMKHLVGLEEPIYEEEAEPWGRALGTWAHNWLARISAKENRFAPFPPPAEFFTIVRNAANQTRADVETLVANVGRTLPAWWFSVWGQAAYVSGRIARQAGAIEGWPNVATEFSLKPPVEVLLDGSGILRVLGRIDLLLADGSQVAGGALDFSRSSVWIVDYKTGGNKPISANELRNGRGFQLALYALALRQLGAARVAMSIVRPDTPATPQLQFEHLDEFAPVWKELCRMQESGLFGALGEMRSEFGRGTVYPLATLEIDADVLAGKWEKTHPGFVLEEDETIW